MFLWVACELVILALSSQSCLRKTCRALAGIPHLSFLHTSEVLICSVAAFVLFRLRMQTTPPFLASYPKNFPKQLCMRSSDRVCFYVVMAQHERNVFCFLLQGSCVLGWIAGGQLCILRGSDLKHPYTLQRSRSTALLVPSAARSGFPCHISPIFLWELRRQPRLPSVRKTPLGHFWRHFFWNGQNAKILGNLCNMIFWDTIRQSLVSFAFWGAVGCRVLWQFCGIQRHSAAILRRPVPHVGFCLEKSILWP